MADVIPIRPPFETATAHLRNAQQIAELYRDKFANMSDEAAAQAAFGYIAAMRDRIQAALEVIEQVKECCSEEKVKKSYVAKSIAITRILTWL